MTINYYTKWLYRFTTRLGIVIKLIMTNIPKHITTLNDTLQKHSRPTMNKFFIADILISIQIYISVVVTNNGNVAISIAIVQLTK